MREREPMTQTMTASEAEREQDFSALFRTGEAFKDVPTDELEQEVTKAVSEVRAESCPQVVQYMSGGPA